MGALSQEGGLPKEEHLSCVGVFYHVSSALMKVMTVGVSMDGHEA